MSGSDPRPSEVHDFRDILSNPLGGELPLFGGHAVNLWALIYRERLGPALDRWLPLTSKDLDLFGTLALLDAMKMRFGGEYRLSGPRSPVVGQLVVTVDGRELKIDVLREMVGLRRQELEDESDTVEIIVAGESYSIRVLPVLSLLQAKIANLATLDQTDRNDFKHVHLMLLVTREYLAMMIEAVESGAVDSRPAIDRLERTLKIATSRDAAKCTITYDVNFAGIWPRDSLAKAKDQRLENFVKHRLPPFEAHEAP
jgi:BMFP domain-containing protein YqiC